MFQCKFWVRDYCTYGVCQEDSGGCIIGIHPHTNAIREVDQVTWQRSGRMHSMTRPCVATSSSALTRTDGAGFLVVAALGQNLLLSKRKSLVLVSRWTACNARAIDVGSTQMMSELYADPRAVGKAKGKIAPFLIEDHEEWKDWFSMH